MKLQKKINIAYKDLDEEERKKLDEMVNHLLERTTPEIALRRVLMYYFTFVDIILEAKRAVEVMETQLKQVRRVLKSSTKLTIDERDLEEEEQ